MVIFFSFGLFKHHQGKGDIYTGALQTGAVIANRPCCFYGNVFFFCLPNVECCLVGIACVEGFFFCQCDLPYRTAPRENTRFVQRVWWPFLLPRATFMADLCSGIHVLHFFYLKDCCLFFSHQHVHYERFTHVDIYANADAVSNFDAVPHLDAVAEPHDLTHTQYRHLFPAPSIPGAFVGGVG